MSKNRMKAGQRDYAQNNRGANEGQTAKRTGEKGKPQEGAVTKRGSTSKS